MAADDGYIVTEAEVLARRLEREKRRQLPWQHLDVLEANAVPVEAIRWLWPGWLAAGKLAILAGAPGTGKTTLALALAATLSRGGDWPDGSPGSDPGDVLIWSGEDAPGDTLVPRLRAAGADLDRVRFVNGVIEGCHSRGFDPATDMPHLVAALERYPALRLLIIDPIVSAVRGDSHKAAEVRRSLQPIADFAMKQHCAVLGITHFSKGSGGGNPLERVIGSQAYGALARVVLVAGKDERHNGGRVLARAKSNIGPDDGGVAYTLEQVQLAPGIEASRVLWGERLEGSAREILGAVEHAGEAVGSTVDRAESFLREALARGPVATTELEHGAEAAGISWASVRRARERLGIVAVKTAGCWEWQLMS